LGLVLNVGGTTNNSTGSSTIETGGASASGNNSDTAVSQAGDGGAVVGSVFGPVAVGGQSAGVSNSGSAQANTGGNRSVGNNSENVATSSQTVSGGLLAVGINLLGGPSNNSDGSSSITTGDAVASGNEAVTTIDQASIGDAFGAGGGFLCDGFFTFGGQHVEVVNRGSASANTGNNASVGNQSTNEAISSQSVSGGLIGLGVNLLSNTSNDSDGTSNISTGAGDAVGNRSTTEVRQAECVGVAEKAFTPPVIVPHVVKVGAHVGHAHELARTGVDPFFMGLVAFTLLFGGLLFLVWERVEAMPPGGWAR
ncbi:MAG: hypothetical protein M3179_09795, partial [Actinomycetota bacterium]|nr:hypothetical protein [Actinomycetota bacterium]